MSEEPVKYDVAISFLAADAGIAQSIYDGLAGQLSVFFYPHNQEELAGTDGLESMRAPFRSESRVVIVLYRPRWGNTNWTRVEEMAIKEYCLHGGWGGLFFVDLDGSGTFPNWLPETHVRLNWTEFGLAGVLGAIKLRVRERGGEFRAVTTLTEARRVKAANDYARDRRDALRSHSWIHQKVLPDISLIFAEMERLAGEAQALGIPSRCGHDARAFVITNSEVSLRVEWLQQYSNVIEDARLVSTAFDTRLKIPGENVVLFYERNPTKLGSKSFSPDMAVTRELIWRGAEKRDLNAREVADQCLQQFLRLVESRETRR